MAKFDEYYFSDNSMNNNSIEDLLTGDEQLLWKGKPKKSAYIMNAIFKMLPIAILWLIFDGTFIGCMIGFNVFEELPFYFIIIFVVFFLVHLTPFWIWLANIITANKRHENLEYAFTNKRIIIRSGLIGIDVKNIYYADVENINLKVGVIDKWLKVGDIYITSKNQADVLWDIESPYDATKKLQEITNDIKSDIYYPNALRPENNDGYNTKYTKNQ